MRAWHRLQAEREADLRAAVEEGERRFWLQHGVRLHFQPPYPSAPEVRLRVRRYRVPSRYAEVW